MGSQHSVDVAGHVHVGEVQEPGHRLIPLLLVHGLALIHRLQEDQGHAEAERGDLGVKRQAHLNLKAVVFGVHGKR